MKARVLHFMLAAAVLGTAACNREEPAPTTSTQTPASQAKGTAQQPTDDTSITTTLQAKFYADDAVRDDDISVATDGGVVTLRGSVESEDEKAKAVALARDVPGVSRVDDQLRVEGAGSDATARRDPAAGPVTDTTGTSGTTADRQPGWITTKIQAQYFVSPEIKPWNIDVTTSNNGIVMLEGEVDSADDKAEAVRIARTTEGVTRVDDRLRVKGEAERPAAGAPTPVPNLERPDAWLTAKVQSKYFLDDAVKGHEIDVDTKDGVVTLAGNVENEGQRRQAVALARSTEGVRDVVDQLKVAPDAETEDRPGEAAKGVTRDVDVERPDEWITMKIQSKYFLDAEVKGHQINVDTTKGVVTLKGTVANDAQKREAEAIARDTAGVTRVVNQLTVKPAQG